METPMPPIAEVLTAEHEAAPGAGVEDAQQVPKFTDVSLYRGGSRQQQILRPASHLQHEGEQVVRSAFWVAEGAALPGLVGLVKDDGAVVALQQVSGLRGAVHDEAGRDNGD